MLTKISGVEVTLSVTSVESSEQFWCKIGQIWRICKPWFLAERPRMIAVAPPWINYLKATTFCENIGQYWYIVNSHVLRFHEFQSCCWTINHYLEVLSSFLSLVLRLDTRVINATLFISSMFKVGVGLEAVQRKN